VACAEPDALFRSGRRESSGARRGTENLRFENDHESFSIGDFRFSIVACATPDALFRSGRRESSGARRRTENSRFEIDLESLSIPDFRFSIVARATPDALFRSGRRESSEAWHRTENSRFEIDHESFSIGDLQFSIAARAEPDALFCWSSRFSVLPREANPSTARDPRGTENSRFPLRGFARRASSKGHRVPPPPHGGGYGERHFAAGFATYPQSPFASGGYEPANRASFKS
jgi:hypothetical protein